MTLAPTGALRRRLTLETPVRSGEDAASATTTWIEAASLWAAVTTLGGREIVDADGVASRVSHEIELRWRSGITATMRFREGAVIYVIHAVRDRDPQRRRLVCLVEEQAP